MIGGVAFKVVFEILKELGFLNILAVMLLLNLPSILFTVYTMLDLRKLIGTEYVQKDKYNNDITLFYKSNMEPLRNDLNKLRESVQHLADLLDDQRIQSARQGERLNMYEKRGTE